MPLAARSGDIGFKGCFVAIGQKVLLMQRLVETTAAFVLDAAPVDFRAPCDGHGVGIETVDVFTVDAVDFFDPVQIREFPSIKADILAAAHVGEAVEGEAHPVIDFDTHIQEECGKEHTINEGGGEQLPYDHHGSALAVMNVIHAVMLR